MVVWENEVAAGGWPNGGGPDEEVASGVVGVWEQVLGGLGLVGGGPVSSGGSWWVLGDAGCLSGCLQGVQRELWWSGRENWLQVAG